MKKAILFAAMVLLLFAGCADSKTFKKADGTEFVAQPYGWMNKEDRIEGVEYQMCEVNIVISVVFSETLVVPILITGLNLYEPVLYNEPKNEEGVGI